MAMTMDIDELGDYNGAISNQNAENWIKAMNEEIESLKKNKTWVMTDRPKDHSIIDCKWIYKIKRGSDGEIKRFKARLVARGFRQRPGLDYEETFSPTARFSSIRLILALAAQKAKRIRR
ncbi:uncharacterized protein LOC143899488 [Temnothorax americanus]|uniref:uncharacterized protein LOC143899488 n=1 Tax=Temnothorax americanus TaxID=1964332 RepID=UPI004067C4A1